MSLNSRAVGLAIILWCLGVFLGEVRSLEQANGANVDLNKEQNQKNENLDAESLKFDNLFKQIESDELVILMTLFT